MKRVKRKIIALVLTTTVLLSCLNLPAFASEQNEEKADGITDSTSSTSSTAEVISEVVQERDANKKVFRLSDGTNMIAEYPQQVHFMKDGKWVDYDNTLSEEKSQEGDELVNGISDLKVRLSKNSNGNKLVRIEKDGYKVSWHYADAKKVNACMKNGETSTDKTVLNHLTSTTVYENIYKNVDLEYIIIPGALKENIILKNSSARAEFEVEYKANGLTPRQADEKTIVLSAQNGEEIYVISAPFMEDANGERSENVYLTLENVSSGKFSVRTTLDVSWLKAADRAYPVVVDPVLKTNQSISATKSAFVASASPNKCFLASGTDDMGSLYVGKIGGYGQTESYIKFETLPQLSVADKVVDAKVYLALNKCEIGLFVDVKQLTSNWDPYTVTWNNRPSSGSMVKDYIQLTPECGQQFFSVEITDLVRGWYSGEYPNYGISLSTQKTEWAKAWFFSIHYSGYTAVRPIMTVTYRNMSGYENYWSYTELPAGRAGTASVNNYNGNFIFTQPLIQNGGNLMPVELSLVYNSNGAATPYTMFHHSVQTNYHIYIRYDGANAANGYKYYLNDSDGTRHWFYFESGSTSGKDEDGLGYTLYEIATGSDSEEPNARFKITDVDGNVMLFDNLGNIMRIRNCSGVSSTVQYETVSNITRIKTITDGAGRQYLFGYSASNPDLCVGITDPSGRSVTFAYYAGLYMWITFPDSKTVSMSRDSSNWLVNEITGIDGNIVRITYDNSSQYMVTEFKSGTNTSTLEKYSFIYKQNETKVTDNNNRALTYQFNDWGQTTGVVSEIDGTAEFFQYEKGDEPGNAKSNKLLNSSRAIKSTTNYLINPGFTRSYIDGYCEYVEDWNGVNISVDQSKKNFTDGSLKIHKDTATNARVNVVQTVFNLPAGTYTASCYINTCGAEISGEGNLMFTEVLQPDGGAIISCNVIERTAKTNGWERRSITFNVPENCQVRIVLGLSAGACGTVWFDDLQLENCGGESGFNLIENASALNGKTSWNPETIIGNGNNLAEYPNYFYRNGDITDRWQCISQIIPTNSKEGDVFTFGAWVKADSVPTNNGTRAEGTPNPTFSLALHYYNSNGSWKGCKSIEINPDITSWQFVSGELILPQDTPKLCLEIMYHHNVNQIAVTGAFCYKEEFGQTYTYDDNGNIVSSVDLSNSNSEFAYNGKQMAQMLTPTGSRYLYNYTTDGKKQLYSALSSSGQEYNFTYDDKGNLTRSEISARKPASVLETGKKYVIVNAYSGLAIDSHWQGNVGDVTTTYRFTPESYFSTVEIRFDRGWSKYILIPSHFFQ